MNLLGNSNLWLQLLEMCSGIDLLEIVQFFHQNNKYCQYLQYGHIMSPKCVIIP